MLSPADPGDNPCSRGDLSPIPGGSGCEREPTKTLEESIFTVCPEAVSVINTFVLSGRPGFLQLKKVLPSIFKEYPLCDPYKVLAECGLFPESSGTGSPYPTFFFDPDRDGILMIQPHENHGRFKRKRQPQVKPVVMEKKPDSFDEYRSQELLEAFEAARTTWENP